TTSTSVSTAESDEPASHLIPRSVEIDAIAPLSLKRLAGFSGRRYNYVQIRSSPRTSTMRHQRRLVPVGYTASVLRLAAAALVADAQQKDDKAPPKEQDARPKLTLKAQPMMAIAPARVVFSAELTGGSNDFQEYYCPTVEWEWGDDTRSESTI